MPLIVLTPFRTVEAALTYFSYASSLSPIAYWRLGDVAPPSIDDTFTGTDGSAPDTNLWTNIAPEIEIQNNKLNYTNLTTGDIANYHIASRYEFVSDFDFQIDFDLINFTQASSGTNGILFGISNTYITRRWNTDGNIYKFMLWDESFGSLKASFSTNTTDTVGKLRFTRVGDTYTAYYWSGSQWEWNGDTNGISHTYVYDFSTAADSAAGILYQKGNVAMNANMDNFVVNSGTYVPRFATDTANTFEGTYKNFPTTNTPSLLVNEIDNQAVLFDGVDQYVSLPTGIAASVTDEYSIVAIVNTNITTQIQPIALNDDGIYTRFRLNFVDVEGDVNFYAHGSTTPADFISNVSHLTGPLYLTLTAKDGGNAIGYVNGEQVGIEPVSGFADLGSEIGNFIGTSRNISSNFFDGTLDEVKIYDKVLTPTEISTLYQLTGLSTAVVLTLIIDYTKVPEDLYNFPVLINLDVDSGITNVNTLEVFTELDKQDVDDDFTGIDGTLPDTELWKVFQGTTTEIDNNTMLQTGVVASNPTVDSTYQFSGDFDIQIDYDTTGSVDLTDGYIYFSLTTDIGDRIMFYYVTGGTNRVYSRTIVGGSDVIHNTVNGDFTIGKTRIARTGTTIEFYYWNVSWQLLTTATSMPTNNVSIRMLVGEFNNDPLVIVRWDNFIVNSGTVVWPANTNPNALNIQVEYPDTNFNDPLFVDDDFTGTDGDRPNLALWTKATLIGGATGEISTNKLRMFVPASASSVDFYSQYKLTGDFDIQVDTDIIVGPNTSSWIARLHCHFDDGDQVYVTRWVDPTPNHYIETVSIVSAVPTSTNLQTTITTTGFRIVRVGTTITMYYWDGASWVLRQTATNSSTDATIRLELRTKTNNPSATVDYDNFKVNSGTIIWPDSITQECKVEVDRWDHLNKQAQMWVKIPYISKDKDTIVTLTANKNIAQNTTYVDWTGGPAAQEVWTEYDAVYHLSSDGADSTVNVVDGTLNGIDDTNIIDFGVGKGLTFNGLDEWVDLGVAPIFDLSSAEDATFSALVESSDDTVVNANYFKNSVNTGGFYLRFQPSGAFINNVSVDVANFLSNNTGTIYSQDIPVNVDYTYAHTGDATTFKDGSVFDTIDQLTGAVANTAIISADNSNIGRSPNDSSYFNGKIKELRFAKELKSTDWISSNYESTKDTFVSYSTLDYPSYALSLSPIVYWRLGDAIGSGSALDEIGFATSNYVNTPTLETPGLLVDDTDTAVAFNGSNQYLNAATLSLAYPYSISVMFVQAAAVTGVCFHQGNLSNTDGQGVYITITDVGNVSVGYFNGAWNSTATTNTPIELNVPYHIVATLDATSIRLYIDNVLAVEEFGVAQPRSDITQTTVGAQASSSYQNYFNGTVDEVLMYDKVLTQKEITSLYQRTRINRFTEYTNSLSPIAYWRLGESSGIVAADETGTFNATYIGTPTLGSTSLLIGDDNPAVLFDGTDGNCVKSDAIMDPNAIHTYAVSFSTVNAAVIQGVWQLGDDAVNGVQGIKLHITSGVLQIMTRVSNTWVYITSAISLSNDTTYHAVVVRESATQWRLYIDGVAEDGIGTVISTTLDTGSLEAFLGCKKCLVGTCGNDYVTGLNGSLDEVSFYDYALNADEVKRMYDLSVGV